MNNTAEDRISNDWGIWVKQPWESFFSPVERNKYCDTGESGVEGRGSKRWSIAKAVQKTGRWVAILGIPILLLSSACDIIDNLPPQPIPESMNKTAVAATREALPHGDGGPIIVYPDASFTPKPKETATPVNTATPDTRPTPPDKSKPVNLSTLPDYNQRTVEIWENGELKKGIPLAEFNGFVIDDPEDPRNKQIGWLQRGNIYYKCTQKGIIYTCINPDEKIPDPTQAPATSTPRPTNSATVSPDNPPTPVPTPRPPEATATKIVTPELVKTWPEKIGNMATDKIEIYNHGKEIGVYSTDWGELVYLAKKLAEIGNVKVKGYEIHFHGPEQVGEITLDSNANYDQNIPWDKHYPGAKPGRKLLTLRPDGIFEIHISLPEILDNYTGAGKPYVLAQLNHDLDAILANNFCGKGNWQITSNCDPEASAFARRSLSFQNYQNDLENPAFTNLKIHFPTAK